MIANKIISKSIHLVFLLVITTTACNQVGLENSKSDSSSYSDKVWGISFEYPSTMVPQSKTDSRIEDGLTLSSNTIQLSDRQEVSIIFLQIVDDPLLASDPGWYPPSETQLKIFAAGDLGILTLEKTEQNNQAVDGALESATVEDIAGFPALRYRVFLNDTQYGYIYVRGAVVITPKRSYTIMVVGGLSKEGQIHETVKPERVDEIWNKLVDTISLGY